MFNPMMAQSETERRYEFVSDGAQRARWLRRLAKDRFRTWSDRLVYAVGQVLVAAGTRLEQERYTAPAMEVGQ